VVNKPPSEGTALSYWHPTPARVTLASLWGRGAPEPTLAQAPQVALRAPAETAPPAATPPMPESAKAPPTAPPVLTTRGGEPGASAAAEAVPAPAAPPATVPATAPQAAPANACERSAKPLQLYVQIYDEASREAAGAVVRALQKEAGDALRIAPIENVTRAAALRGQRRPAPWPQPTLIVHDPADRPCAAELGQTIGATLPAAAGRDASVWVRDLPRSLNPRSNVIELWIPPREPAAQAAE